MTIKRKLKGTEWAEALDVVLRRQVDEVPSGWLTSDEVGRKMGLKFGQASRFLGLMIKEGMVEKKKFKVASRHGTGLVRPTEHYRLTSSAKGSHPRVSASSKS